MLIVWKSAHIEYKADYYDIRDVFLSGLERPMGRDVLPGKSSVLAGFSQLSVPGKS